MIHPIDIPLSEDLDQFARDDSDIRDLVQTTPLYFDDNGIPVGYDAGQLLGLEADELLNRHYV